MFHYKQYLLNGLISSALFSGLPVAVQGGDKHPNIVFILADDLGYGDVKFFNPSAKTETPNIDLLAQQGVAFSEAFSGAAVSTPSRYGILTGRYCFRSLLKSGAINGHGAPVIEKGRQTIASALNEKGYSTAIIGKWHLGVEWQHNANEGRRGQKADVHDGGHHIPLIVSWKNGFKSQLVQQPVSLVDIFATLADVAEYQVKASEAEDSYSFLPLLQQKGSSSRGHVIFHSASGMFGIRQGDWKLIEGLGSGGFTAPGIEKQQPNGPKYQLYNIKNDPLEQVNLYLQHPEIARVLEENLRLIKSGNGLINTNVEVNKHAKQTIYPTYNGLIMAGYQGWFREAQNGMLYPDEKKVRLDMWPDVSEYEITYPTGLKHADGSTARFFSSTDKSTVDLHFKWMKEYGVDGVFMQRFFNRTRPSGPRSETTQVLKSGFEAASKYERAIAVMYDLSGLKATGEDCSSIIEDWKYLVDSLKVTNQPGAKTYLHHKDKPLVAIWGVGFPDRPYNIRNIGLERLIDFLKNDPVYGGCSVMLGVPTYWRDLNADCNPDPYLHELIKMCDVVLPWMVQRFTPLLHNEMDRYRDIIKSDINWCKSFNLDYVPCVTPGFSWHNLSRFEFPDDIKPPGSIPRMGGKFYWQQMATAVNAGASMLYVAMFDEVNEGTAIFKCTDNPPVSDTAKFVGMDGLPSDHYLWLTGKASELLKGGMVFPLKLPLRETKQ